MSFAVLPVLQHMTNFHVASYSSLRLIQYLCAFKYFLSLAFCLVFDDSNSNADDNEDEDCQEVDMAIQEAIDSGKVKTTKKTISSAPVKAVVEEEEIIDEQGDEDDEGTPSSNELDSIIEIAEHQSKFSKCLCKFFQFLMFVIL